MGSNHWIYPEIFHAIEELERLAGYILTPNILEARALDQYLRELLVAQSSDWAFMLHQKKFEQYCTNLINQYLKYMRELSSALLSKTLEETNIETLERATLLFSGFPLYVQSKKPMRLALVS